MSRVKNIALMAHVDAGKTTLTEQMLYKTGIIRTIGSVDDGTARTDDLEVERQRGISVRAAVTSFELDGVIVNMIDTPGHLDFYSQVDRAFFAVDAIIVLVSAVDGVQSGTETIIAESREKNVPVIFFINKCDRGAPDEAIGQIKAIMSGAFNYPAERYETAAMFDDKLLNAYLDDKPEDSGAVCKLLSELIASRKAAPILMGSAYTGDGVDELLRFICDIVSTPECAHEKVRASGVVFSLTHDKQFGRGAYIRLFAGEISVRDTINIKNIEYKASIIRKQIDGRWIDSKVVRAGEIALIFGLTEAGTGDVFGDRQYLPERSLKGLAVKALLTAQISPACEADNTALKAALEIMTAEDPALGLVWEPIFGKMHINVMGIIQIETLAVIIEERFGIKARIGEPQVIYKETPVRAAIGFDAYTMPKPSWAVLKFVLTPAERGSGVSYRCTAPADAIPYRYRGQVEAGIAPSLSQGLYGWEVTDIDINLVDGEDHPIHTHPLDFTIATPLALMDGLRNSGTVLLEPILDIRLTFDAKHLGRIMSDVIKMRGQIEAPVYNGDKASLSAKVPLAASLYYSVEFASITSGFGIMTQKLHGYRECPIELGKTCPRRGVSPLERSKYILAARHAMGGTVFNS